MHDVGEHFRARKPHRQHRQQRLTTRDHARIIAVFGECCMGFGERLRADVVEAGGLHARLPNRRAKRPSFGGPPMWRASATKNCRITILAAPSSRRPPIAATLPPISASYSKVRIV